MEQGQFKKWTNYIAVFCTLELTLTTAYNHIGLTLNFAWPYLDYNVTLLTAHEQHGLRKAVVMATLVHQAPVITVGGGRILPKKSNHTQHKPNWVPYYHFRSQISSFSPILIEVVNIYKHIHYIDISVKKINHEIIHTGTPCSKIKPFNEYISHVISSLFLWYFLAINLHYPCKQISTFYLSSKIYISKYSFICISMT